MNLGLQGQTALVAGSSRGIGRAIAEALLAEGACVVLTGRDGSSLEQTRRELDTVASAGRVLALAGDLADSATGRGVVDAAVARFGRIDHLVANLGSGRGPGGWDVPEAEWQRIFEHNFFASVRLTQAVLPHLAANAHGGSILYIASIAGVEAGPAPLPYSAAKSALINYSKNLSRQLAAQRVRVNCIAPGNVLFPGGSWDARLHAQPDAVRQMLDEQVPQRRFGTPAEIASLAVYLSSTAAGFATGGCFVMDGGQTRTL